MTLKEKTHRLLKKTEKYTKTDNIYLIKYGSWLTLGQIISSVSAFLLALAFANLLDKETYGFYKYIISIAGILAIPTLNGINTAIIQAVSRGFEGSVKKGLKTRIKWGLLGGLASLGLAGYYYFNNNNTLSIAFLIAAVFVPFMDSLTIYSAVLTGKKRFDLEVKYLSFIRIIAAGSTVLILLLTKNLFLIILSYFILYTFLRFLFTYLTFRKITLNKKEDNKTIPYGKHLTLIGLISNFTNYLDKILIFHFLGAAELAIYAFAVLPTEQIKAFLINIYTLALPKLSIRPIQEIKTAIVSKMFRFGLFICLGIIAYVVLAPFFYQLFFPQYQESVLLSQIFSISLVGAVAILPITTLQAKMAKKQLYQINIIGPIIQILLLIILVNLYGLFGIITARIIGRLLNIPIGYFLIKKLK